MLAGDSCSVEMVIQMATLLVLDNILDGVDVLELL